MNAPDALPAGSPAPAGSAPVGNDRAENKWCAWCGIWGNHTSGGCDDLHDALLRRRCGQCGKPIIYQTVQLCDDCWRHPPNAQAITDRHVNH